MTAALQFALTNAIAGHEAEFQTWYATEHMHHVLTIPGVIAAQCFKRVEGPWPVGKHANMLCLEFDDPDYALDQLAAARGTAAMPGADFVDIANVQPPTMWLRGTVRNPVQQGYDSRQRGPWVLMLANAGEGLSDAFEADLLNGGLARLGGLSGVLSAHLLAITERQIRGNARKYPFGILIELAGDAGIESLRDVLPALPHLDGERWLAPVFQPLVPRLTAAEVRLGAH